MSLYRVHNQTPYPELAFPSISREDYDLAVVTLTARYRLPPAGRRCTTELELAPTQSPAPLADVWAGEPGQSSLLWESQSVYIRPGTDIHVHGHACALGGIPTVAVAVLVRVGPCQAGLRVIGERRWSRSFGDMRATPPVAFERMLLAWERAYGGTTPGGRMDDRNPVGVGLFDDAKAATDAALPNLVPLDEDCRNWRKPIRPINFGPIPRNWQPRKSFAGTYDSEWAKRRAPLWPRDLDLRLFSAALPELRAVPWLRGGEQVIIDGMHPNGAWSFSLPRQHFHLDADGPRRKFVLDVVRIDTDEEELTMIWRACAVLDARRNLDICVREALPWESLEAEARA